MFKWNLSMTAFAPKVTLKSMNDELRAEAVTRAVPVTVEEEESN